VARSDGVCLWMNMSADFGETHGKKQGKVMKLGEDLIFVFFFGRNLGDLKFEEI
jgi:hypothetical protein